MAVAQALSTGEKYDVFLSFRGTDTRVGFADCLFEFLKEAGLRVFMDDEELRVGESIGREIQKAIYDSKLFVPIFSSRFASSKWCLKEIAWMADCMEEFPGKKEMLPVFYYVDASDVKLKTDLYANALLEHEKTSSHETVERWRKALIKVPEVKGWNLRDSEGQGKLIKRIAQDINRRLELKHRILPGHFIGIDEQVQDIIKKLDCRSSDVRIVVIHGMGGIGKTTLASAVFNKICRQYQGCSFLSNVRESAEGNGILNLQNKLMRDILRFSFSNFCDVNDAMNCIQGSLRNKDVLVVLDDVSDMDQIEKLVGMGDWVGLGSRVIITTRNLRCVANAEEIENNVTILRGKKIFIYRMRELGFDNSLQLLCRHAFGQHVPPHGYEQLTREVISFTRGVPLAIEVLGSYLRRRSAGIWKEMLNKLRKVPHGRLYQEILMSSYETLCDEEKEIFLDITFLFTGHDKTSAFYYWEACGLFPEMSVDTLISLALVKIVYPNEFWMHDLLKDLGRAVERKQGNGNLGMCSRLCNEDAKRLLLKREGTKHVKALKLDTTHAYNFTPAELSGLSGLRFLELCGGNFVGDFEDGCLSELRWLSWRDFPLDFRWTNFYLENLVVLKLLMSSITESWSGWEQFKTLRYLKVLELHCTTYDFSSGFSLKRLTDRECRDLDLSLNTRKVIKSVYWKHFGSPNQGRGEVSQLPSSICNMKALSRLEIYNIKLNQLPENIGELKGLKVMMIMNCEFLQTLPDSISDLESLIVLNLSGDGITELPDSIGKIRNLTELDVSNNPLRRLPATIGDLDRLEVLDARYNSDMQGEIPGEFGKLRSLESLNLSGTGICGLPSTMVQLACLNSLCLEDCNEIQELPELPTRLTKLVISSRSLKAVPNLSSLTNLANLSLLNGGNHDDYGHNHQVPPYLCDRLDQLSELRDLQLSCPDPFLLSLPSGLHELSLYHSTSLSCWERLSYLGRLRRLTLHESNASEIRLDGLESLTNLTELQFVECEFLERVHDISRLRKLLCLALVDCPKLVEIGGLAQPTESRLYLYILNCNSFRGSSRLSNVDRIAKAMNVWARPKLRKYISPGESPFCLGSPVTFETESQHFTRDVKDVDISQSQY